MVHTVIALLAAGLLQCPAAGRVLYEGSTENVSFRAVLEQPSRFSERYLDRLAKQFLAESGGFKLAKLAVFTSEGDAVTTLFGKGILSQVGYRSWMIGFRQYSRQVPPMADVIVINGAAALRYRDAVGHIKRIVLAGEDPLYVRAGEAKLEIIDVVFPRFPPLSKAGSEVQVFLTTAAPLREQYGYNVTGLLSNRLGVGSITVDVRNDTWFIGNTWFPYFYRFQSDLSPPTHDEYYRSEQLYCIT